MNSAHGRFNFELSKYTMQAVIDVYAKAAEKAKGEEAELELRFRLNEEQWHKLYENRSDPETLELSVVLIGERGGKTLRREIYLGKEKRERVILKSRLARHKGLKPIPFNFVAALESPTTWSAEPIKQARIRRRASFMNGDWRWDFTAVVEVPGENIKDLKNRKDKFAALPWPPKSKDMLIVWELELEWKGDKPPSEADVREALDAVASVSASDHEQIVTEIAKLLGTRPRGELKSILNQPKMLGILEYQKIDPKDYYLSDKADGERAVLYVNHEAMIVSSGVQKIKLSYDGPKPLIIDAELVKDNLYAFDILYYGQSLLNETYTKRIAALDKALKGLKSDVRIEKKILVRLGDDYAKQIASMYKRVRTYPIDGLVFTPDAPYYETVYKWKPPEQLTIDFLIKKPPPGVVGVSPHEAKDGHDLYFLFVGISFRLFKSLNLQFVRGYNEMFPAEGKRQYFPIQFSPSSNPLAYMYYHPHGNVDSDTLDGRVGEFRYNNGWELVRLRFDKTMGNDFTVAEMTLAAIHNPLTIEMLTNPQSIQSYFQEEKQDIHRLGAKFNSFVKAQLLRQLSNMEFVVDLASGKGQDLFTYNGHGVKSVLFVDKDPAAIQELNRRRYNLDNPAFYVYTRKPSRNLRALTKVMDLSQPADAVIPQLRAYMPKDADAVVMNFAIHYFAESVETLKNLATIVDSILAPGGLFIFTCFDGQAVFSLLKDVAFGEAWSVKEGDVFKYSIRKDYKDKKLLPAGQRIAVLHPFSQGELYEEYLVNIDQVIELFPGYKIRQRGSFGDWFSRFHTFAKKELSKDEKVYLSLYHYVTLWKPNV